MVVSPRASHSFRVDVVRNDSVIVGELHMAQRAFPALLNDLAVEQLPHFCVGAKLPVSPGMTGILDPLHPELSGFPSFRDRFPAATRQGAMNRAIIGPATFAYSRFSRQFRPFLRSISTK